MLNTKKLITYLQKAFDIKPSSRGWYSMKCPICHGGNKNEISGAIHPETEHFKCWRAKCGAKRSAHDIIIQAEGINYTKVYSFIEEFKESTVVLGTNTQARKHDLGSELSYHKIDLPEGFTSLLEDDDLMALKARNYVKSRGFKASYLDSIGWGFVNEKAKIFAEDFYGYLIIPFISRGQLVYYLGRDFLNRDKKYKYKNPKKEVVSVGRSDLIYNEDALRKYKTIYLSEGTLCAQTMGVQGVATLGWSLSPVQKSKILKSNIEEMVVAADIGFYKKAVQAMIPFLEHKKIKIINFERPELAKFGGDVNDVGRDIYLSAVKKTQYLTMETAMDIITR